MTLSWNPLVNNPQIRDSVFFGRYSGLASTLVHVCPRMGACHFGLVS